jgi:hypothetical protein
VREREGCGDSNLSRATQRALDEVLSATLDIDPDVREAQVVAQGKLAPPDERVIGGDRAHEAVGEQQPAGELRGRRPAENQEINLAGTEVIEGAIVEQLVGQRRPRRFRADGSRQIRAEGRHRIVAQLQPAGLLRRHRVEVLTAEQGVKLGQHGRQAALDAFGSRSRRDH